MKYSSGEVTIIALVVAAALILFGVLSGPSEDKKEYEKKVEYIEGYVDEIEGYLTSIEDNTTSAWYILTGQDSDLDWEEASEEVESISGYTDEIRYYLEKIIEEL